MKFSMYYDETLVAKEVSSEAVRKLLRKEVVGSGISKSLVSYAIRHGFVKELVEFPGTGEHLVEIKVKKGKVEDLEVQQQLIPQESKV